MTVFEFMAAGYIILMGVCQATYDSMGCGCYVAIKKFFKIFWLCVVRNIRTESRNPGGGPLACANIVFQERAARLILAVIGPT